MKGAHKPNFDANFPTHYTRFNYGHIRTAVSSSFRRSIHNAYPGYVCVYVCLSGSSLTINNANPTDGKPLLRPACSNMLMPFFQLFTRFACVEFSLYKIYYYIE